MKKIGTLTEQVKLTDEEIDGLPTVIKFIKHHFFENNTGTEHTSAMIDALGKLIDLNELEFTPGANKGETSADFIVNLIMAVSATAATKENKQKEDIFSKEKFLKTIEELKKGSESKDKKIAELRGTIDHLRGELSKCAYERNNIERELAAAKSKLAEKTCNDKIQPFWKMSMPSDKNYFDTTKITSGTKPVSTGSAMCGITENERAQAQRLGKMIDEIFNSADYFTTRK